MAIWPATSAHGWPLDASPAIVSRKTVLLLPVCMGVVVAGLVSGIASDPRLSRRRQQLRTAKKPQHGEPYWGYALTDAQYVLEHPLSVTDVPCRSSRCIEQYGRASEENHLCHHRWDKVFLS